MFRFIICIYLYLNTFILFNTLFYMFVVSILFWKAEYFNKYSVNNHIKVTLTYITQTGKIFH